MPRTLPALPLLLALLFVGGCKSEECVTDLDCPTGSSCRLGLCSPLVQEADTSDAPDIVLDCRPAEEGDLVLTEVLADPGGVDVDLDGYYDAKDDEFVEFVNVAQVAVSLLNVDLWVSGSDIKLDAVCVAPGAAHVHFGKSDGLGLNNSGDVVELLVDGERVDSLQYGNEGSKGQSLTRAMPSIDEPWVLHLDIANNPWSPGTCPTGEAFPSCTGLAPVESDVTSAPDGADAGARAPADTGPSCGGTTPSLGQLIIHEILADPGQKLIDANQDGLGDYKDDEFVEIVNISSEVLDLGAVTLSVDPDETFVFPAGTCLQPGQAAVVFATYEGGGDFGGSLAFESTSGKLSLNNGGDTVRLIVNGLEIDTVTYNQSQGEYDQSMTREADLDPTAPFVRHTQVGGAGHACPSALTSSDPDGTPQYALQCGAEATPGRCNTGADFPECGEFVAPIDGGSTDDDTAGQMGDVGPGENSDGTSGPDADEPSCPPPVLGDLFITEVMADPKNNHNGVDDNQSVYDEYIEVVNVTSTAIDASQVIVRSSGADFVLLEGCLPAKHGLLVFGGGENALGEIDKAIVIVQASLALANTSATTVALVTTAEDGAEVILHSLEYAEALPGESFAWDAQSEAFVPHSAHPDIAGEGPAGGDSEPSTLYSPGGCPDHSPMPSCL